MNNLHSCFVVFLITIIASASCTNEQRYKTPTGLRYKLYSKEKDSIIRMGQTVKYHVIQHAGDSIIEDTYSMMPKYWVCMPGFEHRYQPLEIFDYGMRLGDSAVVIQEVDSMVKKRILDTIPSWMKAGDEWITHIKVVDVFSGDSGLYTDKQKESQRVIALQRRLGIKRIEQELEKQKIKAESIGDSMFVAHTKIGDGVPAEKGNTISAHFDIVSLTGKQFNNSRNSTDQEPVSFVLGNGYFPHMIEQQLDRVKAGSTMNYYIPGVLLFGPEPPQPNIRADDDWVITIEVLAVK